MSSHTQDLSSDELLKTVSCQNSVWKCIVLTTVAQIAKIAKNVCICHSQVSRVLTCWTKGQEFIGLAKKKFSSLDKTTPFSASLWQKL